MDHFPRRLISLLLILTMTFSLALEGSALSVGTEESQELPLIQEDVLAEAEQPAVQEEAALTEETPDQEGTAGEAETPVREDLPQEEIPVGEDAPGEETPVEEEVPPEEAPVEDEVPGEERPAEEGSDDESLPQEDAGQEEPDPEEPGTEELPLIEGEEASASQVDILQVTKVKSLSLEYDDRYSFSQAYSGYVVLSVETVEATSYQVSKGSKTSRLDKAVLTLQDGSQTDVIAAGVGSAKVLLVKKGDLARAKEALLETSAPAETVAEGNTVPAIQVNVTVKAARLTMIYLAGQSNAEGYCSASTGWRRQDSIVCPEGEVYSTYLPSRSDNAAAVGGIPSSQFTRNTDRVVAGSLTADTSLTGASLPYGLDTLTSAGGGKTGPDSGLAYTWNQLTGDKVWVVNAAFGGSSISTWVAGGRNYQSAVSLFQKANKVLQAEIAAGHYTQGRKLLFWLQGEADASSSASDYVKSFRSFRSGMVKNCGIQYFGLIMVRAHANAATTSADLAMTGPRIAQYYMGNSTSFSNVYVVSNVNEQWASNSGVTNYFRSAYPGGKLTYATHSGVTTLPKTVTAVHGDVHYSQIAHNENGLTAARTMYDVIRGNYGTPKVKWYQADGSVAGELVTLGTKASGTLVPVVTPLSASKKVTYQYQSGLTYGASTGTISFSGWGKKKITALYGKTKAGTVTVERSQLATPILKKAVNAKKGITVTWNKVSNATSYFVYRKSGASGWTKIATVTTNQYTDTKVTSGNSYTYTVRAYQGGNLSGYMSAGVTCTYLKAPIFRLTLSRTAVKVSWNRVSGASQYRICRRTKGGSWSVIATAQQTESTYTDRSGSAGNYEYAVVALKGSVRSAYYTATPVSGSVPVLQPATNRANGIQVGWYGVKNATAYRVYRKSGSSGWKQIATVTKNSYLDTGVKSGGLYTYTVRAVQNGTPSSYDSAGVSSRFLAVPVVGSFRNQAKGIALTWKKVTGASSYVIYRRSGSSSWKRLGSATSNTYTDTSGLQSGTTYTYTVRAVRDGAISAYSGGKSFVRLDTPKLGQIKGSDSAIAITWQKVSGATSYYVYRKGTSGGWVKVATVTSCSYRDNKANRRSAYTYTVRAVRGSCYSGYDSAGLSLS